MNILILSSTPQNHLQEAIEELGHTWELHDPADFVLYISDKPQGFDSIYLKGKPITRKRFDAIIPRIMKDRDHAARLLKHFTENLGVYSLQSGKSLVRASDKYRQAQILSQKKIRVPKQLLAKNLDPSGIEWIISKVGLPIVAKPTNSYGGNGILILETELSASMAIEFLHKSNQGYILQEFIPTAKSAGAEDIRVIVCGGKIVNAMRRIAPTGQGRANLSIDARGEAVTLTAEQKKLAIEAAEALDFDFVGLDILSKSHPQEKHDYILEANITPGSKVVGITGTNHFLDVVSHVALMAPIYKRSFDVMHPNRHLISDEIEPRQVANAMIEFKQWIEETPNAHERNFFEENGKSVSRRYGEHAREIFKIAVDILSKNN